MYDVIFRLCGCHCGHGYLKLEEEEEELPPPIVSKKKQTKAQLRPELKDVKLKKAKKLSSKSALSDSFKRSQTKTSEAALPIEPPTAEVYIPGLPEPNATKNKTKKRLRKSSEIDCENSVLLDPGVMPFVPRYSLQESSPEAELFYSTEEEEEEDQESRSSLSDYYSLRRNSSDSVRTLEAGERAAEQWPAPAPRARMENGQYSEDNQKHVDSLIESIEVLLALDEDNCGFANLNGLEKDKEEESFDIQELEEDTYLESLVGEITKETASEKAPEPETSSTTEVISTPQVTATSEILPSSEIIVEPEIKTKQAASSKPEVRSQLSYELSAESDVSTDGSTSKRSMSERSTSDSSICEGSTTSTRSTTSSKSSGLYLAPMRPGVQEHSAECSRFPLLHQVGEVWRREGPRYRRKAGEACKHCVSTINGQADFLVHYQQRNGSFGPAPASHPLEAVKEVVDTDLEGVSTSDSSEGIVEEQRVAEENVVPEAVATTTQQIEETLANLRQQIEEARIKQFAYLALGLVLDNMTPCIPSVN